MNNKPEYGKREIYKVHIKAPIQTVWSELVKTTSPRPFFWNSSWDARDLSPGRRYRMISKDGKTVAVTGKIIEIEPPHRLVHSFQLTALDDPPSIVSYTLKEKDGGTEFCLITENILAGSRSEKSMAGGSEFIVKNFKAFVETGTVTPGARLTLLFYRLMAPLTPKSMRAENWPLD